MKTSWTLTALFAVLTLAACSQGPAPAQVGQQIGQSHLDAKVFGGETVNPKQDYEANFVVAVRFVNAKGEREICSGSLVHSSLVVTAAHCAKGFRKSMRVFLTTDYNDGKLTDDQIRTVADMAIPDEFKFEDPKFPHGSPYDLALLKLDHPAPADMQTIQLPLPDFDMDAISFVRFVGFGATSFFKSTQEVVGLERIARRTTVSTQESNRDGLFKVDQTQGTGVCVGDSGGPAYLYTQTNPILVGTLAYLGSPKSDDDFCRSAAYMVRIPLWVDWLKEKAALLLQAN